ncbi:hypothetical protein N9U73_00055 [Candidatus Pelagibacter bacterium]|nr:hypothetical protein [Candidatus Pelagibacter bacterium]
MISKNSKILLVVIFAALIFSPLKGEDKIDIWKNKKKNGNIESNQSNTVTKKNDIKPNLAEPVEANQDILITDGVIDNSREIKVFGVYDPADYNFNLNMWSTTKAEDVRSSIKRIKKINLSKTSNEILENVLLSFSYPPEGMEEKEFVNLKINWLIENNRLNLLEEFLKQNKEFEGKSKAVQYLVDNNIAQANIKEGCEKIKFIDSTIKDSYLEKFKIYCLVFNNKKSQAQLLLDLLREQKQSDKFFDDKINFLLGITEKTSNKINEKNLLNFYLSSVTVKDFNYQPTKKTKKEIWKYLNAANLIKLEDITDKDKIKELEVAANQKQIDRSIIFDIYKQVTFNLNTLINAKNIYQSLESVDARSLLYQKFLLSENNEAKIEYLFLLEELFKKDEIENIYSEFLSDNLKKIGLDNVPEQYKEIAENKLLKNTELQLGKVKYNDKILHQSKIIKFYVENEEGKKIQKEIDKTFKKINKNKKYFYSAKDLALAQSLVKDGFLIPENFNLSELATKYEVPKNLLQLIDKNQNAFLALKIVEIIGEDEPYQLDPETIYFITSLLNQMDLITIRNKVLISALPLRV